jgi:branched-chain amino acid transport system permease protein
MSVRDATAAARLGAATRPAMRRAFGGSVLLALLVAAIALLAAPMVGEDVAITFLINLTAVVGFGVFVGNSGILTFGHTAFMGFAAYGSALLTMGAIDKELLLPDLPGWLVDTTMPLLPAMLCAIGLVVVAAVAVGICIARLPGYSAAIASLGLLIIGNVVLLGARDYTKGASTFYGAPLLTTLPVALTVAIIGLFVARFFRESGAGLQLRASRENESAARSMGIDVNRLRLVAWVLGAAVVAMAGVLQAHFLGGFSPKEFYFGPTFTLLAMLIVGGATTVTGAVAGTTVMSALVEVLRRLESGGALGPISFGEVFGLTQIGLSLALIAVLFFRREGLFGRSELDELILRRRVRKPAPARGEA